MFKPILEFKEGSTQYKLCDKCLVPLLHNDSKEIYSYYIGENLIEVVADVSKGYCPKCGIYWESETAREDRNEAFRSSINNFWKNQLEGVNEEDLSTVMFIVAQLMMKVGREKQRQVASELGRWLADCYFI